MVRGPETGARSTHSGGIACGSRVRVEFLALGELGADGCPHAVTLSLSDDDFGKLVGGKANAQRLFMAGKLKVKGDVMKATKMEPILKRAQTKAKL